MKLEFSKSGDVIPRSRLELIFQEAFAICCDELGIADKNYTVCITLKRKLELGSANTDMHLKPGLPISVQLKIGKRADAMFLAFVHEMVHVRQLVSGDFKLIADKQAPGGCQIFWCGKPQNALKLRLLKNWFVSADPSEVEACGRMDSLYDALLMRLAPADAAYLGPRPKYRKPTFWLIATLRLAGACGAFAAGLVMQPIRTLAPIVSAIGVAWVLSYLLTH